MVAPYDQQDEQVEESRRPSEIPYTSYMPEVQRISTPQVQRRRRRRRALVRIPWIPLSVIAILLPVVVGSVVFFGGLRAQQHVAASEADTEEAVIYVTATPDFNLAMTATSILPPEYLLSLSQTPQAPVVVETQPTESGTEATESAPTPTPPFVSLGPSEQPLSVWQTKIVYVCWHGQDDICLMNADGSEQRQLTSMVGTDWYPSLSPDGQTILFSSQRGNKGFDIYAMDINGGNLRQLTTSGTDNFAPDASPDGLSIVFASQASGRGDQDIWVMNADGSDPHPLTSDSSDEIDPAWSADGTMISFASNRSGTKELFIMNADGSNVRQVTRGVSIGGRSSWSPDGQWLSFYAGPPGDKNIYIVPFQCSLMGTGCDRTLIQQLTRGGNNKGPSFSLDGQWITYASERDGDNEVMIVRVDGSDIRVLTSNNYPDWQPRWGR